jgi:hypothetical protein
MPSIAHIQKQLKEFDAKARRAVDGKDPETALKNSWRSVFSMDMNDASAKSFARYYREMRSKSRSMRGGSLAPAPLDYQMTAGANVKTYGNFPVEAGMDPASIRNLDVYFQDSLTKGCGVENSSRQVPATMGSNKVGGSRRRRNSRKARKTYRKRANRKNSRKNNRRSRRNHRGGNLLTSLVTHPYISTSPSNPIQGAAVAWAGAPQAPSGNPVVPGWNYATIGTERPINPGLITPIGADMTKLASPAPWQTTH